MEDDSLINKKNEQLKSYISDNEGKHALTTNQRLRDTGTDMYLSPCPIKKLLNLVH